MMQGVGAPPQVIGSHRDDAIARRSNHWPAVLKKAPWLQSCWIMKRRRETAAGTASSIVSQ